MRIEVYIKIEGGSFDPSFFNTAIKADLAGTIHSRSKVEKKIINGKEQYCVKGKMQYWKSEIIKIDHPDSSHPDKPLTELLSKLKTDLLKFCEAPEICITAEVVVKYKDSDPLRGFFFSKETIQLLADIKAGLEIDVVSLMLPGIIPHFQYWCQHWLGELRGRFRTFREAPKFKVYIWIEGEQFNPNVFNATLNAELRGSALMNEKKVDNRIQFWRSEVMEVSRDDPCPYPEEVLAKLLSNLKSDLLKVHELPGIRIFAEVVADKNIKSLGGYFSLGGFFFSKEKIQHLAEIKASLNVSANQRGHESKWSE